MFGLLGGGSFISVIFAYIDLLWLPITFFAVHKHQRIKSVIFTVTCLLTLRVQVELMESIDRANGVLPFIESHVFSRGVIFYSVIIALFLVLAHFSPRTEGMIFFAAALSIYILSVCLSMLLMAL